MSIKLINSMLSCTVVVSRWFLAGRTIVLYVFSKRWASLNSSTSIGKANSVREIRKRQYTVAIKEYEDLVKKWISGSLTKNYWENELSTSSGMEISGE